MTSAEEFILLGAYQSIGVIVISELDQSMIKYDYIQLQSFVYYIQFLRIVL